MNRADAVGAGSTGWQRAADRLGRFGWRVLLVSVVLAVVGSAVSAFTWEPGSESAPVVDECPNPPCFGGGGLPAIRDLPTVIPTLGYAVALLLGVPSLLVGVWDLFRARPRAAKQRLLLFVGPLLVFVGIEVIPHLLSPCAPAQFGLMSSPGICERTSDGIDIKDQWHSLDHALVGALPMAALYWLALRRWRPEIAPRRHR